MYIPIIYIPAYTIIIGLTLALTLIANPKHVLSVTKFYKYKFFKFLIFYIIWVCLSGLISVIAGNYSLCYYLYATYLLFIYGNFSWYIFPYLICPKVFSIKFIAKFIVLAVYIICFYGLIEFVFKVSNIHTMDAIQNIIVNRRTFEMTGFSNYDLKRLISIFEEPGYLGGFICINLPIIYNIIFSPFKILKNKYLNFFVKKSYLIVLLMTITCIQSPIWFIVFAVISCLYFRKQIISQFKNLLVIACIIILSCFVADQSNLNLSQTIFMRINKTIDSFGSMQKLIKNESSLATRIIAYYIRVKIFIKNPICGVGYRNAASKAGEEYQLLDFTGIEKSKTSNYKSDNGTQREINGAIFWNTLSDTGIIGTVLFYLFLIYNIKKLNYISKKLEYSIEKLFASGIKNSYITIIFLSVYDLRNNFIYYWFLYGLTLSLIEFYKIRNFQTSLVVKNNP